MSQSIIRLSDEGYADRRHKEILAHIREKYGNTTQILVSNEELCELAAVCAKFPRYTSPGKARTELHSAAIDEVADVLIILDHIINIFQLEDAEIWNRVTAKVGRIARWLAQSDSQEQTTVDRAVYGKPILCGKCEHFGNFQNMKPGHPCYVCINSGQSQFTPRQEDLDGTDDP